MKILIFSSLFFLSLLASALESTSTTLTNVTINIDPSFHPKPFADCIVKAALLEQFGTQRIFKRFDKLYQIGHDSTPDVVVISFEDINVDGETVTHEVRLKTLDPYDKWQHLDIPSSALTYYSHSVSTEAELTLSSGEQISKVDISSCSSL